MPIDQDTKDFIESILRAAATKERDKEGVGGRLEYRTGWHPNCTAVVPVWVGYPALWCPHHKCLAHVDLVMEHVGDSNEQN